MDSRILADTSQRLRSLRMASGLKQVDFCRRVGLSAQAWNNYESGLRLISIESAIKVCLATNVTLDWMYRGVTLGLPAEVLDYLKRESDLATRAA
jgi:transcriptional regulator with XRE-family HTH domain